MFPQSTLGPPGNRRALVHLAWTRNRPRPHTLFMPTTKTATALQETAARIASLKARTEALRAYTAELRALRAEANTIASNARKGA